MANSKSKHKLVKMRRRIKHRMRKKLMKKKIVALKAAKAASA